MSSHQIAFHILQSTLPTSCRRMSLATAWSVMTCHESSWNILESYNHLSDPVQFLHGSFMKDSYLCYILSHLSVHLQRCQKPLSKRTVAMPKHGKATAKFLFASASQEMCSFELVLLMRCHWLPLNTTWQRDSRDKHWSILESLVRLASVLARSVLAQVKGELLKPPKTA